MLNHPNFSFAREQAIDIARDRIAHLTAAQKAQALEFIDLCLQEWKLNQDVIAANLVVQGVEAIARLCLRFRVQRHLQLLNTLRSC